MTHEEILTATALASWKQIVGRVDGFVTSFTDEQFEQQISPGRNRVRYLIGHLTAVNDRMFTQMGIGERMYTQLDEAYVTNPDGTVPDPISIADLKQAWLDLHNALTTAFEKMTVAEWLEKHTAVSAEDFAKEPLRNRFAMLLSRTGHVAMHAGQALLAK